MARPRRNPENGDTPARPTQPRMSITIDPSVRRLIRIAAAHADMEPTEWAATMLRRMAEKAVPPELRKKVTT